MRRQLLHELRLRVITDDAVGLPTVLEQDHARDCPDAEAPRGDRIGINIELRDADLVALLVRDVFEDRRDHAARTAPRRPEIDEHGGVRLQDLLLEGLVADDLWLSHLMRLLCPLTTSRQRRVQSERSLCDLSLPPKRELLA